MYYAQEKESGSGFDDTEAETDELTLSMALCNLVWRASKDMLWTEIMLRFLMAEEPSTRRTPSPSKTIFTALTIEAHDSVLEYSNDDCGKCLAFTPFRWKAPCLR